MYIYTRYQSANSVQGNDIIKLKREKNQLVKQKTPKTCVPLADYRDHR